jgi:hypothetical protein
MKLSLEIWSDQVTSIFLQFTSTEVISNVEFCHYFEILCNIHEVGRFVTVLLLTAVEQFHFLRPCLRK